MDVQEMQLTEAESRRADLVSLRVVASNLAGGNRRCREMIAECEGEVRHRLRTAVLRLEEAQQEIYAALRILGQ